MRWVAMCKPRVLILENVEEFQTWGPILVGPDGQARPDPARRGKTFKSFVRQLRIHGYQVDWRELRASDHGTPTIRKRLFLVARRDGLPIVWPEQTHAEPTDRRVIAGKLAAHRTAAECIDFCLHAESVFGSKRSLVDNTIPCWTTAGRLACSTAAHRSATRWAWAITPSCRGWTRA